MRIIIEFADLKTKQAVLQCITNRWVEADWVPNEDNELQGSISFRNKTHWKAFCAHVWDKKAVVGMTLEFF